MAKLARFSSLGVLAIVSVDGPADEFESELGSDAAWAIWQADVLYNHTVTTDQGDGSYRVAANRLLTEAELAEIKQELLVYRKENGDDEDEDE